MVQSVISVSCQWIENIIAAPNTIMRNMFSIWVNPKPMKLPDRLEIRRQPGHQVAGLGRVIVLERQLLQFLVAGVAQPVRDPVP